MHRTDLTFTLIYVRIRGKLRDVIIWKFTQSFDLGVYIFNLRKTWEKLVMAARIIVAIENPADVCVISARPYSQVGPRSSKSL